MMTAFVRVMSALVKVVVVVLVVACEVGGGFGGGLVSKSHGLTVMRRRKIFLTLHKS